MPVNRAPRYRVRLAQDEADLQATEGLRHRCFRQVPGQETGAAIPSDRDAFDNRCQHVLIEALDKVAGTEPALVASFRLLLLPDGGGIEDSYSAQYYDLTALRAYPAPMLELGRFCIHPDLAPRAEDGAEVLRLAWGELTRWVEAHQVGMLFGCSSFRGTDAATYRDTFALLRAGHLAPETWAPGRRAGEIIGFAEGPTHDADRKQGLKRMPPLLRSYLAMGGWVSDHAVVDRDLGTLHVFTGLEIASVPPERARLLRDSVGGGLPSQKG